MNQQQSALFPTYPRYPLTIVKGEGSRVWDDSGKEYLDFMSGIAVTNVGHVHPAVKKKVEAQLSQLWHISNLFHIPQQEQLAQRLVELSCADAAFFCNSGAEANEAAIKLARKYQQTVRGTNRYEVITFQQSFHGRTLATLTATGQDKVKKGFQPLPDGFVHVPYNDIEALNQAISDKTGAIMLEFVQGEGGVRPADPAFVEQIVRLCQEHELLLIADEVQTGMGRTGRLFAYEHYGVEPDIITLAKGLGSGFPIGAMLGKRKLVEAFGPGSHGTTFGGNPLACTAALATVETIIEENLHERAAVLGEKLTGMLREWLGQHSLVQEIRGKGLIIGIVCTEPSARVIERAREEGLLVIPAGPQVVRLLPPLTISEAELERGVDLLCAAFDKVTV